VIICVYALNYDVKIILRKMRENDLITECPFHDNLHMKIQRGAKGYKHDVKVQAKRPDS
jgi:hypothetical protein